jgi:hypothetical protein
VPRFLAATGVRKSQLQSCTFCKSASRRISGLTKSLRYPSCSSTVLVPITRSTSAPHFAGIAAGFAYNIKSEWESGGHHLCQTFFLPFGTMATQQDRPRVPNVKFRVLIIGRANAGKTSILQRVCDTTESPEVYRLDRWGTRYRVRPRS